MSMEAGTYKAKIVSAGLTENQKGEAQARVDFVLEGGEAAVWFGGFSSEKAMGYTVKQLTNAGWTTDDLGDLPTIIGAEVEIVVQDDEYNGKVRQRVKYINGPRPVLDAEATAGFAASMKARIAKARAAKGNDTGGGQIPAGLTGLTATQDDDNSSPF